MPLNLDDSSIIVQLDQDIRSAWEVAEVHTDAPRTPGNFGSLPRAFCLLRSIETQYDEGGGRASRDVRLPCQYEITGQFPWPSSGTFHAAKVEKAQALLELLTADRVRYAGWFRRVQSVTFDQDEKESGEPFYLVQIIFTVFMLSDA